MFAGRDRFGFPEKIESNFGGGGFSSSAPSSFIPNRGMNVSGQQVVGQAMVRTGIAILMVPDPLPLIDEVVAGVLVAGGAAITLTA